MLVQNGAVILFNEKLRIALHKGDNIVNKQTEVLNKQRHRNKYSLELFDYED